MLLQILAEGFAQNAHAAAVDDSYSRHPGQKGAVYEPFDFAGGVVDGLSDYVDFGWGVQATGVVLQRDIDAPSASGLHRRIGDADYYLGDIFARDTHLHRADFCFEVVFVKLLFDYCIAAHRFELHRVAFGYVFHERRLGVWIAAVRARGVGYHGRVELVAEFAAQVRDAALGVFGEFLRGRAVLDGVNGFARVILEVTE